MTAEELILKYHIKRNISKIFEVLDILYVEYTKEQALAIVEDYLDHADEIYNSLKELGQ